MTAHELYRSYELAPGLKGRGSRETTSLDSRHENTSLRKIRRSQESLIRSLYGVPFVPLSRRIVALKKHRRTAEASLH